MFSASSRPSTSGLSGNTSDAATGLAIGLVGKAEGCLSATPMLLVVLKHHLPKIAWLNVVHFGHDEREHPCFET